VGRHQVVVSDRDQAVVNAEAESKMREILVYEFLTD
jgi:hypothetical protein